MLLASMAYPFSYKLPSPACLQSFSRWTGNGNVPRREMAHCEVARLENSRGVPVATGMGSFEHFVLP
jgi:hypothetical protein